MVDSIESIAVALLALITASTAPSGSSPFPWASPPSRAAKIWGEVDAANQPCLFLIGAGGNIANRAGYGVSNGVHHFHVLVYLRADAETGPLPETQLNAAWGSVVNAMMTNAVSGKMLLPGQKQTLGLNFVNHAWVEGDWFMDTGILDNQCALVIPLKVAVGIIAGNS